MARLFIVGSSVEVRARWDHALSQAGHECSSFTHAAQAWRAHRAEAPDLIVSGLFMPVMDGIELLRKLREEAPSIPTVVLEDDGSERMEPLYTMASILGAVAVVPNGLPDDQIQETIATVLAGAASRSAARVGPPTRFAPAARGTAEEVRRQAALLEGNDLFRAVLSSLQTLLFVVNEQRQVVFANEQMLQVTGLSQEIVRGMRSGEAISCTHAYELEGGCGTTEACRTCGIVRAMLTAIGGQADVREARVTLQSGLALDLRVGARPLNVDGERFVVVSLEDIAAEQRRRVLERVFFHDVLNTAGGIQGLADLVNESEEAQRVSLMKMLSRTASQLVREINSQRVFTAAERDEYAMDIRPWGVREAVEDAVAANLSLADDREVHVRVTEPIPGDVLMTDPALLGRVLGNLTKNAVEASSPGQTVTLSAVKEGCAIAFRVHNPASMPRDVELQVFQRSFSTKGSGRGLGTYSTKLFMERYLGGSVTLETSKEAGTLFTASLPCPESSAVMV